MSMTDYLDQRYDETLAAICARLSEMARCEPGQAERLSVKR